MSMSLFPTEAVPTTEELAERPSRPPEFAAESRALVALAQTMATTPDAVLQQLADLARELCRADSAGVSIAESDGEGERFRWHATSGKFARYNGETVPRRFSPCGAVLQEEHTLLMREPDQVYTYLADFPPRIWEALLVPFFRDGAPIGTLWVVAHTPEKHFDREDARLVSNLTQFASAAVKTLSNLERAEGANRELQLNQAERQRMHQELVDARERLDATLAAAEVGTWTYEVARDLVRPDPNLVRLVGLPADSESAGVTLEEMLDRCHPDDREPYRQTLHRALAGEDRWRSEHRALQPDGSVRWVLCRGMVERDEQRNPVRMTAATLDISERKRAESTLQESQQFYATLTANLPGMAYRSSRQAPWPLSFSSDGVLDLTGYTADDFMQHRVSWFDIVHPDDLEWMRREVDIALAERRRFELVYRIRHASGEVRWVFDRGRETVEDGKTWIKGFVADYTKERLQEVRERQIAAEAVAAAEANAKFKVFFEQGVQFAAVLSLEGAVVEVNRVALEAGGFRRAEVLGQPFWECGWWRDSAAPVRDAFHRAAEGEVSGLETEYADAGGSERMLDLVLAPVTDDSGRALFVAVRGTDITDRRQADLALRDAHSRIASTLASAEVATWVWDIPTNRVHGDRNLLRMYALPPDGDGSPIDVFLAHIHPDDVEKVSARMRHAVETAEPYEAEYRIRKEGGSYCHFVSRGRVEYGPAGEPLRMPGVLLDITRQKRAEADLALLLSREQQRTDLLRRVARASRSLNASLTVEGLARTLAAEARTIIGARRAVARFAGGDDRRPERVAVSADGPEVEDVVQMVPREERGGLAVPLIGHQGHTLGVVHVFEKRGGPFTPDDEAVLVQLAAIGAIGIENARLYERLRDHDQRKDEFLATLAHELRNPLAPIWNALSVLRRVGLEPRAMPMVEMMDRQLAQLARLVDDLLDVSRVTSGKIVLRKERVEIRAVIEAAVETSRPVIEEGGHELTVRVPVGSLPIDADAVRIAQIVTNLLNNAAKYTPHGGRIELAAVREGADLVVRVTDTGIGISSEMLTTVFDMFTQIGASLDRSQGGLGIGLTLVRKLVEMHGGRVCAESPGPGRGSTFVVRLPLAADAVRVGPTLVVDADDESPARRILVVDDNRDTADSLALLLKLDGHETMTAYDGRTALAAAREWHPQVVLLDIGLPGMSGYEVAEHLRRDPEGGDVVLIAVTGWGAEEDRERSREAGFDQHLVKPVDPDCVTRLLASGPRRAGCSEVADP